MARALDRAQQGTGSLLLVEGPAGIGKTRLLAEAADLARTRDVLVRRATGGELERDMPFGVMRQLLDVVVERSSRAQRSKLFAGSAALALSALGQADTQSAPVADPFAPIHGLYWLLANMSDSRPVVLCIDDAHWADHQTLRFLDYLGRRLQDLAVLVVAGARSGEPEEPPELERIRLQADLLRPRSLSRPAVDELITARLGSAADAELSRSCWQATAGNPFLLAELLRGLRADSLEAGDRAASEISKLAPDTVARYVLLRLGRFGEPAIALARAIAVLEGASQLRHGSDLAGLDYERAVIVCDRLRQAEILTPGAPVNFVHPLIRQAIYHDLPAGLRSGMHRRAAEVLHSTGAGARAIAAHLMACEPNGDQWLVGQLGEAAWEAIQAGAYDSAQSYLTRALEEPPDDELPLLYALGGCMLATDPVRGSAILHEVADRTADEKLRIRALRNAAQGHFTAGEWDSAARCHAAVLELLPKREEDKRLWSEAEFWLVAAASSGRDVQLSQRIERVSAAVEPTSPGRCLARVALGVDRFRRCAPVDEVVELAGSFPPGVWEVRGNATPAGCGVLAWSGRWNEARRATRRLIESGRQLGRMIYVCYLTGVLALVDRLAGRLADAEADARTALEMASAMVSPLNPGREATMTLLATLLARGEVEEAQRLAEGMDLSTGPDRMQVTTLPIEARGYLRLARGELDAATEDLLALGEQLEALGWLNPAFSPWRQEVAPALAALGRSAEARELVAVAEERARAFGAAHVIGTVLRSRALIEPRKRQIQTLRESVAALETYGPPHELARSLLELGSALRRQGQRSESREPLRRALDLAARSGAGGLERRARDELAAAGSRPRSAYRTGVAALTASELRTARLAADGLNNREIAERLFVTRRTVETHLTHAYQKLGISERGELRDALTDEHAVTP